MPILTRQYRRVNELLMEGDENHIFQRIQVLLQMQPPAEVVKYRITHPNGDYRQVTVRAGRILLGGEQGQGWKRTPWRPSPEMLALTIALAKSSQARKEPGGRLIEGETPESHSSRLIGGVGS
jgi:hypothetical protein